MSKAYLYFIAGYAALLTLSFTFERISENGTKSAVQVENQSTEKKQLLFIPGLTSRSDRTKNFISEISDDYEIVNVNYRHLADSSNIYSAEKLSNLISEKLPESFIQNADFIIAEDFGAVLAVKLSLQEGSGIPILMINPKGILEFELLGGYHLNQGVYTVGSGFFWFLENLVPDFGYFTGKKLNYLSTRILLDTDLRQFKDDLRALNSKILIINADSASSNQLSISSEIERLALYSSILSEDVSINEFQLLLNSESLGNQASADERIKSLIPFSNSNIIEAEGWLLAGLMLLIVFCTFVSEDLACIGAGLMAARGLMGFEEAVLASFLGIFFGDILIYIAGRWLGTSSTEKAPLKWFISPEDVKRSNQWFHAKGPAIILISRFIPGTRFPTYFSAGILGTSLSRFVFYFGLAALIWTPALVGLSMFLGQELIYYFSIYQEYALWVLLAVVVIALVALKIIVPLFTYRGRRLLYGKLKRTFNWEFWPIYVLYAPVVMYAFRLWLKFKKPTVVTAANHFIEYGGFKGESKSEILSAIKQADVVPKFRLLSSADNFDPYQDALEFISEHSLSWPIVLKPDAGERGKSVQIIKNELQLELSLTGMDEDFIIQEFIPGKEFGVFYYRYPGESKGQIFSITKKEKLKLVGDGKHTLEHLILKDKRAVCMAETHFEKHADYLFEIPKEGEEISLVELGTHSRGAVFTDGENLITEALRKKIDEISQSIDGFYFGRYDVIVPDEEFLKKGEQLKVIELNGVTSESTNIYDPEYSFIYAVKTLCKQWAIAYEIGDRNCKNGVEIPSFKELMKEVLRS